MIKMRQALQFLTVNAIVASLTAGTALGVSNALANHVHWLGAYLIACPARSWELPKASELHTPDSSTANNR